LPVHTDAAADHYFLLNDTTEPRPVTLTAHDADYVRAQLVLEERDADLGRAIELPAHSAVWLRAER